MKFAVNWSRLQTIATPNLKDQDIAPVLARSLLFIFPIAGFALLIYLIFGGFNYLTSGGDPNKVAHARSIITTALIGFIIVFFSYWIVRFFAIILGLDPILEIFPGV